SALADLEADEAGDLGARHLGDELGDGYALIIDERLLHQRALAGKLAQLALDDLGTHRLGLALGCDLLLCDATLALDHLARDVRCVDRDRIGRGDVQRDLARHREGLVTAGSLEGDEHTDLRVEVTVLADGATDTRDTLERDRLTDGARGLLDGLFHGLVAHLLREELLASDADRRVR